MLPLEVVMARLHDLDGLTPIQLKRLLGGTKCARRRGAVKVGVVGRSKGNIKLAQQSIVSKECK